MKPKFVWERHANRDSQALHTPYRMPYCGDVRFPGDKLTELDKAFLNELRNIEGVSGVSTGILNAYEVHVIRGKVFDWEPIEQQVEAVVEKYYNDAVVAVLTLTVLVYG